VQERVTRAVRYLNEAKALLCIEPFDNSVHHRTSWGRIFARCSPK
jgi:hypothetical protein